jgi:hypothetical protein
MTHLDMCNTSYGQMKGRESNWQFDLRPRKVRNRPNSIACKWRATCHWKDLDERYNFNLYLILIGGLHKKLWTCKVARVPTLAISGLSLGSPGTKTIQMPLLRGGAEYTIWGKVMASPESGPWWVLWVRGCSWVVLTPKVFQLVLANLLVGLVQVYVNEWNCLSLFLVPSRSSDTPFYLSKVLRARECALSS